MSDLLDTGWPSFISADRVAEPYLPVVRDRFGDYELVALDTHDGPVAAGWAVPLAWDSTLERSEEHTSELQSRGHLVCRLLLEKKKNNPTQKQPPNMRTTT